MREIKFRAWDTIANGWMSELLESGYSENNYDNPYGKDEWYTKIGYMLVNFDIFKGRLIWSQYTGLKDKNGVEIYEGDIVNFIYRGASYINMPIHFENQSFITDDGIIMSLMDNIEVIGNIYENPNLLKEK